VPDKALDYSLGLAHARSDGFDAKTSGAHNPDRDGYRSTSGNARLGYQINASTSSTPPCWPAA
jgi:vitamin B12 transporter